MSNQRKCCDTLKGSNPHHPDCLNATPRRRQYRNFKEILEQSDKKIAREILDDVYGDLPDGAYFAVAEEFGLEPEDFIED